MQKKRAQRSGDFSNKGIEVEEAELFISLVVPAYNEEDRLEAMLTEAVDHLEQEYGISHSEHRANGSAEKRSSGHVKAANGHTSPTSPAPRSQGWEVLIVSDGSTDKTIATALQFARKRGGKVAECIRVVALQENRGKGGAVVHGMRHVRGQYAVFADADGASRFPDLGKLVRACQKIEDSQGRGIAIGSRAHLVGSEAVVKASPMHATSMIDLICPPPAFPTPQLPHALLPPPPPPPHPSRHSRHPGHAMRLQTLLAAVAPAHHALHARRVVDLRRGNAHAGRIGAHPCRRGPGGLERGPGQQAERSSGQLGHGLGIGGVESRVGDRRLSTVVRCIMYLTLCNTRFGTFCWGAGKRGSWPITS